MLVRPCIQIVPGKNAELSPSGYSLHSRESVQTFVEGPGGVTTSDLAWSHLGVEPAELYEIAVDREVLLVILGCCPHDSTLGKNGHENE